MCVIRCLQPMSRNGWIVDCFGSRNRFGTIGFDSWQRQIDRIFEFRFSYFRYYALDAPGPQPRAYLIIEP